MATISYFRVAIQIFEQQFHALFIPISGVTAPFNCQQFLLLPPTAFFTVLSIRPEPPSMLPGGLKFDHVDLDVHKTLAGVEMQIKQAAKAFCRRDKDQGDE